jgi:hypothetical protein
MYRRPRLATTVVLALLMASAALAQDWPRVEKPSAGVTLIYDDYGAWGGQSQGASHQVKPDYRVRKHLDLSGLPDATFNRAKQARLLVYFAAQDYSWNMPEVENNGLDESFEIVVNENVHHYPTAEVTGARAGSAGTMQWGWRQFEVPVRHLVRGDNVIEIRKSERDAPPYDDYIYVGIDNTESRGHSEYREGGAEWTSRRLNTIGATGEYMVRLVLLENESRATTSWIPGEDPVPPIGYVDATTEPRNEMQRMRDLDYMKLEFDPEAFDPMQPIQITVDVVGSAPRIVLTDETGKTLDLPIQPTGRSFRVQIPAGSHPDILYLGAAEAADSFVRAIHFEYSTRLGIEPSPINMAPVVAAPAGGRVNRVARCVIEGSEITISDPGLECRFVTQPALQMTSLYSNYSDTEMLRDPALTHLFLVEVDGRRYGAEDFTVEVVGANEDARGFVASLLLPEHALRATLEVGLAETGQLTMYLALANAGEEPLTFKTAFPHLGGLAVSTEPANDYYMFPAWGGIIASENTLLRTSYGEETAWWQMIDLYSPARGAGVAMRSLDDTGLYKCPTLRKGVSVNAEYVMTQIGRHMQPEMYWQSALEPGDGTSMAFEYLRRTRAPGEGFTPPAALLEVHPGDWHEAMTRYSRWAHTAWEWRPLNSELSRRWSIVPTGGGQSPLYTEAGWRTDVFQEGRDALEMWSWWEWSEVGPWNVPMDRIREDLGNAFYERYKAYFVMNHATGKVEYPINRGDYDYNEDWGGLPALRDYVQQHRDRGILPLFYVEGILCCDTTRTGRQMGEQYGVMNELWTDPYNTGKTPEGYVGDYASWNMCSDTVWWPDYLAQTVARVCRETGVGGVRLDEYGHRGFVCTSDKHEHIFAEPGHNAWMQAVARSCGLVREAMDEVDPKLVLMTEFPGNDFLARHLDGCIVYESMSHVKPIRPVPVNLFRFYFPRCKVYDLDRNTGDSLDWQFFNAMARYAGTQTPERIRILKESSEIFDGRDLEPLIPTLRERVYANRFNGIDKQITMLYSDVAYTVDGPMLPVKREEGWHYFDLLRGEELTPRSADTGMALSLKLGPGEVACIARLPELLSVERVPTGYRYEVTGDIGGLQVQVCDAQGQMLAQQSAARSDELVMPAGSEAKPACVKLVRYDRLLDIVEMP